MGIWESLKSREQGTYRLVTMDSIEPGEVGVGGELHLVPIWLIVLSLVEGGLVMAMAGDTERERPSIGD